MNNYNFVVGTTYRCVTSHSRCFKEGNVYTCEYFIGNLSFLDEQGDYVFVKYLKSILVPVDINQPLEELL